MTSTKQLLYIVSMTLFILTFVACTELNTEYRLQRSENSESMLGPREYMYPRITPPHANPYYTPRTKEELQFAPFGEEMIEYSEQKANNLIAELVEDEPIKEVDIIFDDHSIIIALRTTKSSKADIEKVFRNTEAHAQAYFPDRDIIVKGKRSIWYDMYYHH